MDSTIDIGGHGIDARDGAPGRVRRGFHPAAAAVISLSIALGCQSSCTKQKKHECVEEMVAPLEGEWCGVPLFPSGPATYCSTSEEDCNLTLEQHPYSPKQECVNHGSADSWWTMALEDGLPRNVSKTTEEECDRYAESHRIPEKLSCVRAQSKRRTERAWCIHGTGNKACFATESMCGTYRNAR